jgi:hypothetical protein
MIEEYTSRRLSPAALIAPCGMNCGLCCAFLRTRNSCPGCRGDDRVKCKTRFACKIKLCPEGGGNFCTDCASFPCERLSRLDKRYRTKYGMSMIDNLRKIEADGLRSFVASETSKWTCPGCGKTLCVHKAVCLTCGHKWR